MQRIFEINNLAYILQLVTFQLLFLKFASVLRKAAGIQIFSNFTEFYHMIIHFILYLLWALHNSNLFIFEFVKIFVVKVVK